MHRLIYLISGLSFTMSLSFCQTSAEADFKKLNVDKNHLALRGYDPVSYFHQGPVQGNPNWTAIHAGITYLFVSGANRDTFALHPEKYVPAYGGWCAYAMALKGQKVEVDPLTYKIVEGRLLLFYNKRATNTLKLWNQLPDPEFELLNKADDYWKKIQQDH